MRVEVLTVLAGSCAGMHAAEPLCSDELCGPDDHGLALLQLRGHVAAKAPLASECGACVANFRASGGCASLARGEFDAVEEALPEGCDNCTSAISGSCNE
eukprot:CAMPEP_0204355404 /NCGR_PEP_ID=MMETSP0469-20131031/34123_1 /ASSEMBLY_ACC=CAM_ASM_000384 /TAXON_ID=2969 /ORGANISM="Oxyrrhis marina" /LENGTH=99 /DNA_ID=CAMNT_0051342655 /DNA_START=49 /DNA_END=345 /DNA_ORIENTATION=-